MTKSRQSVTKLRLSRLIRCLLALGCIKLAIIGYGALELHHSSDDVAPIVSQQVQQPQIRQTVETEPYQTAVAPDPEPEVVPVPKLSEELPQGSKAAELAAASRPQTHNLGGVANMPAPLVPAEPASPFLNEGAYLSTSIFPAPSPLGEPLAQAGVSLPEQTGKKPESGDAILNLADLKALPIPGLGGVQVAHAASINMPVPTTPPSTSPFTPAEQLGPVTNQGRVLPGAPAFPQNIPAARPGDGAPLPPRQPTFGDASVYAPNARNTPVANAPAPNVPPRQSSLNPNMRAQELARQQQDILMLRQQMDQRLHDLQNAEDKMKDMLEQAKNVEDQKVKALVQMYANMKPRTAAQALENMDERIAVRILSGMAPKQSGEILTYTNPVKTAKFTEMITRLRMGD